MGNTYSYFLIENSASQSQAIKAHNQEVSDVSLNNLTLYLQALATTARQNFGNTQVQAGYTLFIQAKCNSCHFYLHDSRARNLTEAILWHDG